MKKQTRKTAKKVTIETLLEWLPKGEWFSSKITGLIVSVPSFYQHMRNITGRLIKIKKRGCETFYMITTCSMNDLLDDLEEKQTARKQQKIVAYTLTVEDKLHNLVCFA